MSSRPRSKARIAGLFYMLEGGTSAFGAIYVAGKLTVSGNAATTAANVLTHQPLLWWGFAAALVAVVCHVVYTILFYELLRPVNKTIALIAACVSLVAAAIQGCACLFEIAPLLIVRGGRYLSAFRPAQLHALALMFFNLDSQAFNIYLVFFGFWLVMTGYLIFRSTFVPRLIGALALLAGLSYVTLLSPSLASYLSPYYLAPDVVGEPVLMLWLVFVGVNPARWAAVAFRQTRNTN
jgi:hypothetical protein